MCKSELKFEYDNYSIQECCKVDLLKQDHQTIRHFKDPEKKMIFIYTSSYKQVVWFNIKELLPKEIWHT